MGRSPALETRLYMQVASMRPEVEENIAARKAAEGQLEGIRPKKKKIHEMGLVSGARSKPKCGLEESKRLNSVVPN
ncbi:hypothetical protein D8674_011694 [Pyrus ussuriensis x Pyrus communis]|uniref:Uncharacterized protein n=1 Tax=Pyrus ussuriensis x Pyrus communis TaxID=2448454 RepID=A0A5N5FZK4_9ROSA|nr:hypothetical protein D8674_011694 [Pyrus ussuriensis x Pyrus communis]